MLTAPNEDVRALTIALTKQKAEGSVPARAGSAAVLALAEEMLSGLPRKPEDADPAALTLHKLTGSSAGDEALRRLVFSSGSQERFCCGRVSIFLQSDLLLPPLPNPTLRVPPLVSKHTQSFPPAYSQFKLGKMIQKNDSEIIFIQKSFFLPIPSTQLPPHSAAL